MKLIEVSDYLVKRELKTNVLIETNQEKMLNMYFADIDWTTNIQ